MPPHPACLCCSTPAPPLRWAWREPAGSCREGLWTTQRALCSARPTPCSPAVTTAALASRQRRSVPPTAACTIAPARRHADAPCPNSPAASSGWTAAAAPAPAPAWRTAHGGQRLSQIPQVCRAGRGQRLSDVPAAVVIWAGPQSCCHGEGLPAPDPQTACPLLAETLRNLWS